MVDQRIKGGPLTKCGSVGKWECEHVAYRTDKACRRPNDCAFYMRDVDGCRFNDALINYRNMLRREYERKHNLERAQEWIEAQEEITWG